MQHFVDHRLLALAAPLPACIKKWITNVNYSSSFHVASTVWSLTTLTSHPSGLTWTSAARIAHRTTVCLCRLRLCGSSNWTSRSVFGKSIRIHGPALSLVSTTSRSPQFARRNGLSNMTASTLLTGASSMVIVSFSSQRAPSYFAIVVLLMAFATAPSYEPWP